MKHFIFLILLASSCRITPESNDCFDILSIHKPIGASSANTNLTNWNECGAIYDTSQGSLNLRIGMLDYSKCDYYELDLNHLPLKIVNLDLNSEPNLIGLNSNFTIISGGDAIAEKYILEKSSINRVRIDKIDSIVGEVSGRYTLSFILDPNSIGKGLYDPSLPDTLRFTDGVYTAKFQK